jgi:hypothetical protein
MASSLMFKVPGSKTWCGMEMLDKQKVHPDTMVEIKDISVCRYKASHGYGERLGKMPLRDAKLKYSI